MFRGCRIPLCGCFRNPGESDLGPAQARVADGPETKPEKEEEEAPVPRRFSWGEVDFATGKFADSAVVGEGGTSTVYLGCLPDFSLVAVKLHHPSERLHRAFRQELDVLLRLRHSHIVRLLGYCDDYEEEGALVFEYVPKGSLHEKLHGREVLPWAQRMAIAYQVAQALEYLHDECDPQVVHGDVKTANVLLDWRMKAKLCDFGSARVGFSAAVGPPRSGLTMAVGSPGYIDPHYLRSGMLSKKCDVYSFGVLLLELVTGAEAFDADRERRLTEEMVPVLRNPAGRVAEAVDTGLGGAYDAGEASAVIAVAAVCVGSNPSLRPTMAEVVGMLREKTWSSIAAVAAECDGKKTVVTLGEMLI